VDGIRPGGRHQQFVADDREPGRVRLAADRGRRQLERLAPGVTAAGPAMGGADEPLGVAGVDDAVPLR
jgi:hypothetical protein